MPNSWFQQTSAFNLYCSLAGSIACLGLVIVNNTETHSTWIHFPCINVGTARKQKPEKLPPLKAAWLKFKICRKDQRKPCNS